MNRHRFAVLCLAAVVLVLMGAGSASSQGMEGDGAEECAACHSEVVEAFTGNVHTRIRPFEVQGRRVGCEGCHGDGTEHVESADPSLIHSFGVGGDGMDDDEVCASCHQTKSHFAWNMSTHATEGVGCLDCHSVHAKNEPLSTCRECHGEVEAQFRMPSHHPVKEGKLDCASCHDVHGATRAGLKSATGRVNDLCSTCHLDKEGPHVFEHPPVVEDCSSCHQPHGAVANNLLVANEPMLCLQCHEFHFHAGYQASESHEVDVGGVEYDNENGIRGFNIAFTTKCTQCHTKVHGTDLPSQAVPGQGQGLVR